MVTASCSCIVYHVCNVDANAKYLNVVAGSPRQDGVRVRMHCLTVIFCGSRKYGTRTQALQEIHLLWQRIHLQTIQQLYFSTKDVGYALCSVLLLKL